MPRLLTATTALLAVVLASALAGAAEKKAPPSTVPPIVTDDREAIVLTASERAQMLKGMRTYLDCLQGITEALAKTNDKGVAEYARRAGAKMLLDVPVMVPVKMPVAFTALSLATHDKFDQLAARAEKSASRGEVLSALAEIMVNCTSCHSAYRVVAGP